ncbi:hypothetical protein K0M31_004264 [Melipona bicolor]|uniref:Uncharacterized protein n=1 Tax=Melipona bicolor TaxID=60889 RepID=A0AA40KNF4_9HYME|nr:hypothetical protein K0M31_004264 [Melipona bicolor]
MTKKVKSEKKIRDKVKQQHKKTTIKIKGWRRGKLKEVKKGTQRIKFKMVYKKHPPYTSNEICPNYGQIFIDSGNATFRKERLFRKTQKLESNNFFLIPWQEKEGWKKGPAPVLAFRVARGICTGIELHNEDGQTLGDNGGE